MLFAIVNVCGVDSAKVQQDREVPGFRDFKPVETQRKTRMRWPRYVMGRLYLSLHEYVSEE